MSDFSRHARQLVLPEVGVAGQQLLRDSSVLIVGAGGLGSPAALYLAAAGIGRLVIADLDRVERSNLQRQILYTEADVGRAKTTAAAARISALDAAIEVSVLEGGSEHPGFAQALQAADLVLDCTDNFSARYQVNAACVRARKPLVSGAAIRFEGQLAAFDLRRGGPCYACLYPASGAAAESCEDSGVLGPVAGVIGAMQALLALQLLLGHAEVAGHLQVWDARRLHWRKLKLSRDPACPVCATSSAS